MEKCIVKISKKHCKYDDDLCRLIAYVAGKGKNEGEEKAVSVHGYGVSNKYKKAPEHMIKIQKLYGKDKDRRCYQMVVSFETGMDDLNMVILAADAIACMIFEEMYYQVFYGIHTSTDNLHIHFVINAVNYRTGKKWHQSKPETEAFKREIRYRIEEIIK